MNTLLQRIHSCLNAAGSPQKLGELFCQTLHWSAPRGLMSRTLDLGAPIRASITLDPVAQLSGLPVYRVVWPGDRLPGITARRAVQRALKATHAEHLLCYVTQDARQLAFTWARERSDGKIELRTLPYEAGSTARTTIERLGELAFSLDELTHGEPPITAVTDKLDRAFDVETVTRRFFDDYKKVFATLQRQLFSATADRVWAHDYALQLLNRLMFLYFIQRKRWLGDNPNFVADFWRAYKDSNQPADSFFERWLSVLFFEAFNNKFHGGHRHFPEEIRSALQLAPYLNGGLFTRNQLDDAYSVTLPDAFFATLFDTFDGSSPGFLERYNFTIAESTPLDIEVAVDPEMIGKVYESLVNITSEGIVEEDQRGSAGIFYTSRVEIDLMCRLALVDALANRLGADKKPLLYDTVFAYEPAEKDAADAALAAHNLWPELDRHLRDLTVCDPACGSGSFLIGMLLVLDDLQARANAQLGREETPYERRRRIIGEQLYGVDVMDWAVHVAELRLWLQLVVETELKPAELKFRPLLPNLSFKVRCGDSLVQEIGGIDFGLHRAHLDISPHLKGRITQLKGKKLRFYQGEQGLREADLKKEELDLFRDILANKQHALQNQIVALTRQIESPAEQGTLPGMDVAADNNELRRRIEQLSAEREEKQAELARITDALAALRSAQHVPFVWDIAFVEIFEGDRGGFDIVIGNPPYVRQEMIAPPHLDPNDFGGETSDRWKEQKKAYKAKLQQSVAAAWPRFLPLHTRQGGLPQARRQKRPVHLLLPARASATQPAGQLLLHHLQLVARCWLRRGPAGVSAQTQPCQIHPRQRTETFLRPGRRQHDHRAARPAQRPPRARPGAHRALCDVHGAVRGGAQRRDVQGARGRHRTPAHRPLAHHRGAPTPALRGRPRPRGRRGSNARQNQAIAWPAHQDRPLRSGQMGRQIPARTGHLLHDSGEGQRQAGPPR